MSLKSPNMQSENAPSDTTPAETPVAGAAWLGLRTVKIAVGMAGSRGRGVFAKASIEAGEVIEISSTVELKEADCDQIARSVLDDYYFAHPTDETAGLMVLGLASLCNHDADANSQTLFEREPELGWIVRLVALREIAPGEEITRRYACSPWFTESKVTN